MLVKVGQGSQCSGRTIDVSENGASLTLPLQVSVGERLSLELFFRDSDPFPIRLVGECRWAQTSDIDETVAGLDLTPSHARSLAVLRDYLSQKDGNS